MKGIYAFVRVEIVFCSNINVWIWIRSYQKKINSPKPSMYKPFTFSGHYLNLPCNNIKTYSHQDTRGFDVHLYSRLKFKKYIWTGKKKVRSRIEKCFVIMGDKFMHIIHHRNLNYVKVFHWYSHQIPNTDHWTLNCNEFMHVKCTYFLKFDDRIDRIESVSFACFIIFNQYKVCDHWSAKH